MENKSWPWVFYIIAASGILLLLSCICAIGARRSLGEAGIFTAYQMFAIFIPGLAYTSLLEQDKDRGGATSLFIAYALGYSSNIAWYYLLVLLGRMQSNPIAYVVVLGIQGIFSVWYLVKEKKQYGEEGRTWMVALFFVFAVFFVELFTYSGCGMLPPYTNGEGIWNDVRYWMGNTVALKIEYPPVNFRTLKANYNYHFFSSMQLAMESIVTGIPVAELSIDYSFIQAIILIVGGGYCLLGKYVHRCSVLAAYYFLLLFATGYEDITRVTYVSHIYMSQYGFDYGIGFMLYLMLALSDFYEKKFSWRDYCFALVLFVVLMGTKSTFACIGLVGIGWSLLQILLKGNWKRACICGIIILGIFALMYMNVLNVRNYSGAAFSDVILWREHHWDYVENLNHIRQEIFSVRYIPDFILEVLFWVVFAFLCSPCFMLLILLAITVKLMGHQKLDGLDMGCIMMLLAGVSVTLYIYIYGKSNVYFVMAAYPVALLFICRSLRTCKREKLVTIAMICIAAFGLNLFLNHAGYEPIIGYWINGVRNFAYASNDGQEENKYGVSQQEYEALCYACGIDRGEILLSINYRGDDMAGIFCEHKVLNIYLENDLIDRAALDEGVEGYDIKYIIMPVKLLEDINGDGTGTILFENEEWCVLQINSSGIARMGDYYENNA